MVLYIILCAPLCEAKDNKSISTVEHALASGDVNSMSTVFDKTIDITFSDYRATTYSKAQAEAILKKFFAKSGTKEFKLQHKGKSTTNNTLYAIGILYTNNANYRVYMFFVPGNNEYLHKELRFEKL